MASTARGRLCDFIMAALSVFLCADAAAAQRVEAGTWTHYGGDPGGGRGSDLTLINRDNVSRLRQAWVYRTGDVSDGTQYPGKSRFQATPIVVFGTLYLSTPFNRIVALDPETGAERWTYDPRIDRSEAYSEAFVSRGVAAYEDASAPASAPCRRRIFIGTMDARLIAVAADNGRPCAQFGNAGVVDLVTPAIGRHDTGDYSITSPPTVIGNVVVVGSAIGDNRRVDVERGIVRAYDARSGALLWSWDPIPRTSAAPGWADWQPEDARITGGANAWSIISADSARGLIFVPTGSAAPDFFGGRRRGNNLYANSVVALRVADGRIVWHFQVVHHDLWDYDVASQPLLTDLTIAGRTIPVVVQATKMGHIFVLHRETGEPVFPVSEKRVTASHIEGESAATTQPFPTSPAPLLPTRISPDDAFGLDDEDRNDCRQRLSVLRNEGIFTPPSLRGSLEYPSYGGGVNWGGAAYDRTRGILVVAVNRIAAVVQLIPRQVFAARARAGAPNTQFTAQAGTAYGMARGILRSARGSLCTPPPWGTLVGIDLASGTKKWEVPSGRMAALGALPNADSLGSPSLGGALVTAGGLVFFGAAMDDMFRARDIETGAILWEGKLPAGGQATPMTYRAPVSGRQFVVIAAGGHGNLGTTLGDYLIAFALQ
jgi:quinoprotein glucose dehydrogenase